MTLNYHHHDEQNRRFINTNPSVNANLGRAPAPRKAAEFVIPLKPDYTISDSSRIKRSKETVAADGAVGKETTHIPKLPEDASNTYQILDFLGNSKIPVKTLQWTTGYQRFDKIKQHFQGLHKDTWSDVLTIGTSRLLDAFQDARQVFLSQTFEETRDYDVQMDYLRSIIKPPEM